MLEISRASGERDLFGSASLRKIRLEHIQFFAVQPNQDKPLIRRRSNHLNDIALVNGAGGLMISADGQSDGRTVDPIAHKLCLNGATRPEKTHLYPSLVFKQAERREPFEGLR